MASAKGYGWGSDLATLWPLRQREEGEARPAAGGERRHGLRSRGPGSGGLPEELRGRPPSLLKLLHTGEIKGPQLAENGSARDGIRVQTDGSPVLGHATRDFDPSEDPGENPDGHHHSAGVPEANENAN